MLTGVFLDLSWSGVWRLHEAVLDVKPVEARLVESVRHLSLIGAPLQCCVPGICSRRILSLHESLQSIPASIECREHHVIYELLGGVAPGKGIAVMRFERTAWLHGRHRLKCGRIRRLATGAPCLRIVRAGREGDLTCWQRKPCGMRGRKSRPGPSGRRMRGCVGDPCLCIHRPAREAAGEGLHGQRRRRGLNNRPVQSGRVMPWCAMDEAKAALMLRFLVGGRTTRAATRAKSEGHSYVDWSLKLERFSYHFGEAE